MSPTETHTDTYAVLRDLLDQRWTCRQFTQRPVDRDTIETLLRLAQRTPSWCNTQPWQVTITEGEGTERFRTALLDHITTNTPRSDIPFPTRYDGVFRDRRRECGAQLYESVGIARDDKAAALRQTLRNFALFDAPHVAIITTEADLGPYGALDCGLYLGNFLLGAQSLGLGAAPQAALATYSPFLREHFAIPDNRQIAVGVSFGYPDRDHPVNTFRTTRADIDDVVTWHTD
ncbi:nitroreductase [Nocardia bovistercoris]|uniref:Nitroreductase n=1 Tax=Nocardia bovistercoris TaxID=2785916 RepID=A0A931IGG6_9NOCA|nr:nitroreductase [Nocardia bovistercoris]MBH0779956.1 nitroreductase [Nocardia bovistercoris]